MDYHVFANTYVIRLDPGDEIVQSLLSLAAREKIFLAHLQGVGAVNDVTLKSFSPDTKQFQAHMYHADLEIVSLTGNLTILHGRPYAHLHIAVADSLGHVYGGHLNRAVVSSTCEIFLTRVNGWVERRPNPELGLNTLSLS